MARSVGGQSVGVLGGGLAGLALACLLAERGHQVTVYERDRAGGKLRRLQVAGQWVDTGPSLFTFPQVWQAFLMRLNEADPLNLRPLSGGLGTYYTPFGQVPLPVPEAHPLSSEWQRYCARVEPLRPHLLTLLTTPPRLSNPGFLRASHSLFQVLGPHLTAQRWIQSQPFSPALAHAIGTQALNAGLAPQVAPALYALLPALMGHEVYRPAQGMGALLDALLHFAQARGVEIQTGAEIAAVNVPNLTLSGGQVIRHNLLVSALDPQRLAKLRGLASPSPVARRTVSGVALYAVLPEKVPLAATNVIPPSDFGIFHQSIRAGQLPPDTLALIHADGPKLAVLLTVPAVTRQMDSQHPWVGQQIQRIELVLNVPGVLESALDLQGLDPLHYAAGGHPGGAIYGAAYPAWRGGPLHPQPYRLGPQLWQVGTGVHPGGGIPAILGGAMIVDQLLERRLY